LAFLLELLEWTRALRRGPAKWAVTWLLALAGFVAHTSYLLNRSHQLDLPPLLSSTHDWMLVLAWVAVLFFLFLTATDRELAIGLFLLPLVLVLIGAAYFVSDRTSVILSDAKQGWAMLHASLLVFGIAGVILGFVLSLMYLVQHRRLKQKQTLQEGATLPSLARLARLNWWAVMISVPLLTLGMLTGVLLGIQSKKGPVPFAFTDPVVLVSGVVWLCMIALFVWLLARPRTTGKQVAWLTVWAFGFLLVTVIGLQVLTNRGLPSLHSRMEGGRRAGGVTLASGGRQPPDG
jgi:ABC-type uncharacterized transport system permease subunit